MPIVINNDGVLFFFLKQIFFADSYLSAGSISAIVLAVVLLILIIVGLILLCRYCCRKRSESVDLPSYRGPSSRRT